VPVIIYGETSPAGRVVFDVHTADASSISFHGWPVKMKGNGEPMINYGDFNGDGVEDMMVHINRDAPLDVTAQDVTANADGCVAMLKGQTLPPEKTAFQGCDKDVKFK